MVPQWLEPFAARLEEARNQEETKIILKKNFSVENYTKLIHGKKRKRQTFDKENAPLLMEYFSYECKKLTVPWERLAQVSIFMGHKVKSRVEHAWAQPRHPQVSCLFGDWDDFCGNEEIQILLKVVNEYFPRETTKWHMLEYRSCNPTKPGTHFVFPDLYVTDDTLMRIRAITIERIVSRFKKMKHKKDEKEKEENVEMKWEKIFDAAVYTSRKQGLRLPGHVKATICTVCDGAGNKGLCTNVNCTPYGRIYGNRAYVLHAVHPLSDPDSKESLQWIQKEWERQIYVGSLYPSHTKVATLSPISPNAPEPPEHYSVPMRNKRGVQINSGQSRQKEIPASHPAIVFAQKAIQGWNTEWKKVMVKKANWSKSKHIIFLRVTGPGSQFCMNKGENHTKSDIYFIINKKGRIIQKCWSKSPLQRLQGCTCSKYSSMEKPLPLEFADAMQSIQNGSWSKDIKMYKEMEQIKTRYTQSGKVMNNKTVRFLYG